MQTKEPKPKTQTASKDSFFLPDFCAVKTIFILCIAAQLIAFVLILATGDVLHESWDELGLLSIFVQWVTLSSAGLLCTARRFLKKLSISLASITAYFMVVGVSILFAYLGQLFIVHVDYQWGSSPETIEQFVIRAGLISAIITFVVLRYFYVQQQWKNRLQLESEAKIQALQARIRPHFLFNSMNIIASLIRVAPDKAEQAVEDLSELYRATLKDFRSMISFYDEWHICQNYLNIEALRLDDRLKLSVDLDKVPKDALIPMLTLQPLVENAIYHGIQPLPEGGEIKVTGRLEANNINISIQNPVTETRYQGKSGKGNRMALENIKHRLNLIFEGHSKLLILDEKTKFTVQIIFPYIKQ